MDLTDIESTLKKGIEGNASAHIDENAVNPELRGFARLVNLAVIKITEGHEAKKRADSMIRDNPLAIAVLRADKSRISINKQYEVFWRGTYEELMKKKLYDFNIKVLNGIDFYRCFESKKLEHTETMVSWPDGVTKYLNLDAIPIFDDRGNFDGAFYVWSDVTELHLKMEEVKKAQFRIDRMLADNPLAIAVLRADKSRISINKQYEVFWRGTHDELMKKKLYDFDITVLNDVGFYQCFETKKLEHTETLVSWPDGVTKYLNLDAIPILDEKGNFDGAFYVWSDVTSSVKTGKYAAHEIDEMARLYTCMAEGDLTVRYTLTAPDADVQTMYEQLTKLRDAVRGIVINLQKNIGDVNSKMQNLTSTADNANKSIEDASKGVNQIARNTGGVSENAQKAAGGVDQISKAMQDMSAAVEEITSSMESVTGQAKTANDSAKNGALLADTINKDMTEIAESSNNIHGIVMEIGKQMADISKIIVLIRDLANQTNLLALNAAIEAARAGEHGRGFAVVASEVKSLAQESRSSAEKIEEMITHLNAATKKATEAMETSKELVGKGAVASADAVSAFKKIQVAVETVANSASEVAAATEEQAATTEEITASVHEVANLIEQTAKEAGDAAAATEESAAALDEITRMIQTVNDVAVEAMNANRKFKVE